MLFPIITGMLWMGRGFAKLVQETGAATGTGGIEGIFLIFVKLTAYIGPFFFVLAVFKFAGGAFANLAGMANDRSKGIFDRQKKYRGEKRQQLRKDLLAGNRYKNNRGLGKRINNMGRGTGNRIEAAKRNGLKGAFQRGAIGAAGETERLKHAKHAMESVELNAELKNDDFAAVLQMAIMGKGDEAMKERLREKGYSADAVDQTVAQANALRREHGGHALAQATVTAMAASKTSYTGGFDEMAKNIYEMAEGDEAMAMKMLGEASAVAANAGRHDLGGGSFGEKAAMVKSMFNNGADTLYEDDEGNKKYISARSGSSGIVMKDAVASTKNGKTTYSAAAGDGVASTINSRQGLKALDSLTYNAVANMHPTAAKNIVTEYDAGMATQQAIIDNASSSDTQRANAAQAMGVMEATMENFQRIASSGGTAEVTRIANSAKQGGTAKRAHAAKQQKFERNADGNIVYNPSGDPVPLPERVLDPVSEASAAGYASVAPAQPGDMSQQEREAANQQQQQPDQADS